MIKRVGVILPVIAILISSVFTILSPQLAHASTVYDDLIQTTDTLRMTGTSCTIDVPNFAAVVTDLVMNDSVTWSENSGNRENIQTMWENRTAMQIVQQGTWTGSASDEYIQIVFSDDPSAYFGFGNYGPTYQYLGLYTPTSGYHQTYLSFDANSTCSTFSMISGGSYFNSAGNTTDSLSLLFKNEITAPNPSGKLWAQQGTTIYPSGYEGIDAPDVPSDKQSVYPTIGVSLENQGVNKNKVLISMDQAFIEKWHLPSPNYIIITLTNYETEEIIEPTEMYGPYPRYIDLPNGNYTAHLVVVYTDTNITDAYDFKDAWFNFTADGSSYSIFYNPNEEKYCSVRGGYEWNCDIPQPEEESTDLITGEPEEWEPEECSITDLGACVRNILHLLSEYLGINGPSVGNPSSPFLQFDTNTFGLTAIISAPLAILTNLSTAEYTCTVVNLPLPFIGGNLPLPCMNSYYTTYLGTLYTMWQTIINGLVAYWVIVGILKMVKDAKDPQKDQIEVLNL